MINQRPPPPPHPLETTKNCVKTTPRGDLDFAASAKRRDRAGSRGARRKDTDVIARCCCSSLHTYKCRVFSGSTEDRRVDSFPGAFSGSPGSCRRKHPGPLFLLLQNLHRWSPLRSICPGDQASDGCALEPGKKPLLQLQSQSGISVVSVDRLHGTTQLHPRPERVGVGVGSGGKGG